MFLSQLQVEGGAANEEIYSLLLGVNFIGSALRVRRQRDKFVVAWPERKLVYHVLRFRNVNGGVTRTFDAAVGQIKRKLRSTIAFVGDEEDRLAGLLFEIAPDLADRLGQGSPAAQPIARVAPPPADPDGIHHQTDERRAHDQGEH